MITIDKKTEAYLLNHSTAEDEVLYELYRETHIKALYPNMLSGHLQGRMLSLFSCMIKPVTILEIGTYTGYSAICLCDGLQENGTLYTIEINDELKDFSEKYFRKAGVHHKIKQLTGNALDIIPGMNITFDLVFIDAEKSQYPAYYDAVIDKVRAGGFIIADNVLWYGKVLEETIYNDQSTKGIKDFNKKIKNDVRVENLIMPMRDGLNIIRKK